MDKSDEVATSQPVPPGGLRILLVLNLAWDPRLGAVRVFMELADQWREAGHTVETYTASDAFSARPVRPAISTLRQIFFGFKAASFIRKNANRFDVVDALIGSLRGSKKSMGFSGLLVARSVGLYLLYERFERAAQKRWPDAHGRISTKIFYDSVAGWFKRLSNAAVRYADLINVPNEEEKQCLQEGDIKPVSAITVQPYGLTSGRREALSSAAASRETRLSLRRISFLGMWAPRKGSRDWSEIMRLVWRQIPEAHFCFLGTMVEPERVLRDLGLTLSERIETVPEYSQDQLPGLLSKCVAGAFPSYVEGFGIAVLEQLAAGLPTVAFDVAGPRDMLSLVSSDLLVPAGNVERFAESLVRVLRMESSAYADLASRCRESALRFDWRRIASETASIYRTQLAALPRAHRADHAQ